MTKVTDIRTKMSDMQKGLMGFPEFFQKGERLYKKLPDGDKELITGFIFNIIMRDLEEGLENDNGEIFFHKINEMYSAYHAKTAKCFLCKDDSDADVGICMKHLMILSAKMVEAKYEEDIRLHGKSKISIAGKNDSK